MGRIVGENKHKGTLYPVDSKAVYRIIYEVVAVLPTENIKTSVIYCVPIIGKDNEYDMFLYIDGWSKIGSGSIDLSDYYTKEEVDDIVADISTLSFKIVQEKPTEDIETNIIYLIPKSGSSVGNIYEEWIYIDNKWELLGTTDIDLSSYMTLAPLNPTAQEIEAMSSGQLYSDTTNHKGVIKGCQEFYDTNYISNNYYNKTNVDSKLLKITYNKNHGGPSTSDTRFKRGDMWLDEAGNIWLVSWVSSGIISWERITPHITSGMNNPPSSVSIEIGTYPPYERGDLYFKHGSSWSELDTIFVLLNYTTSGGTCNLEWVDLKSLVDLSNYYTKTEIDAMIPTVPTNISAFTNDSGYLTLETLPIYDGTVI